MEAVRVKVKGLEQLYTFLDKPSRVSFIFDDQNNEIRDKIDQALKNGELLFMRKVPPSIQEYEHGHS